MALTLVGNGDRSLKLLCRPLLSHFWRQCPIKVYLKLVVDTSIIVAILRSSEAVSMTYTRCSTHLCPVVNETRQAPNWARGEIHVTWLFHIQTPLRAYKSPQAEVKRNLQSHLGRLKTGLMKPNSSGGYPNCKFNSAIVTALTHDTILSSALVPIHTVNMIALKSHRLYGWVSCLLFYDITTVLSNARFIT